MKQIPGCILPYERKGWEQLLAPIQATEETLVDVWRHKHPDESKVFTWA
jgi:exonuclease III